MSGGPVPIPAVGDGGAAPLAQPRRQLAQRRVAVARVGMLCHDGAMLEQARIPVCHGLRDGRAPRRQRAGSTSTRRHIADLIAALGSAFMQQGLAPA